MRTISRIFCLPLPLLLLIPSYSTSALGLEVEWHQKHDLQGEPLEVESLGRRNVEIQSRLAEQRPCGVKKMPADEGEMFFLEYWLFDRETRGTMQTSEELLRRQVERQALQESGKLKLSANVSIPPTPQPPLLLHTDQVQQPVLGRSFIPGFAWLYRREFICPGGTTSCSSIGQPNSCCQNGLTCNAIPDTGLGVVGCCAAGASCAGQVAGCPSGYSSCPSSQGGGCCIPGYECSGVGCILSSTTTVIVYATVTASIPSSTSTPVPTPQTPSSTSTTSSSTPTPTPTSTSTAPSSTSTSDSPPPPTSSTLAANAPLRPTSAEPATTIPSTITVCPTGFYQCSAYFNGANCCQVGRDCGLTSCPPHSTATAIASNGVTVVNAPTGGVVGGSGTICATGWFLCGGVPGQGCCPSGYSCSGQECLAGTAATATGATASVPVQAATSWGSTLRMAGWGYLGLGGWVGIWALRWIS